MADAFDLVIIGAGPGGYVERYVPRNWGLKTAIVERSHSAESVLTGAAFRRQPY